MMNMILRNTSNEVSKFTVLVQRSEFCGLDLNFTVYYVKMRDSFSDKHFVYKLEFLGMKLFSILYIAVLYKLFGSYI